jgi:hypothetical protein
MKSLNQYLQTLDFVVVGIYLIILIAIGFWVSFIKKKKEGENLFLAGKSLGWKSIGLTMWGTNVGPSMLIVSAASGFSYGIAGANFSWYAFVFIMLLAMVFAPYYNRTKVSTLPEFIGKRYNNTSREMLAWYSLVTILVSWLGITLYAGGLLVSQVIGWPLWVSVLVLAGISAFFANGVAYCCFVWPYHYRNCGSRRNFRSVSFHPFRKLAALFAPRPSGVSLAAHCTRLSCPGHLVLVYRPVDGTVCTGGKKPQTGAIRDQFYRVAENH